MTTISWTDETWNPVTGCSKVSPGCAHCYAEGIAKRFQHDGPFVPWTVKAQRESGVSAVTLHPDRLDQPLKWKKPRRIFVNSMSDLFHEDVPDWFLFRTFNVMADSPHHIFQLLTKRPERMKEFVELRLQDSFTDTLPNVWLGVSVENQRYADERIPLLLETPAAVRFISAEPLVKPVNVQSYLRKSPTCEMCISTGCVNCGCNGCGQFGLDWVIAGCESGPKRRPMETDWARRLRDQCQAAGVPFFLKQIYVGGKRVELPELDGRVWAEYPSSRSSPMTPSIESQERDKLAELAAEVCACEDPDFDLKEPSLEEFVGSGGCLSCWNNDGHSEDCSTCSGTGRKWPGLSRECYHLQTGDGLSAWEESLEDCHLCDVLGRSLVTVAEGLKWVMEQPTFDGLSNSGHSYRAGYGGMVQEAESPFLALVAAMEDADAGK